MISFYEFCEILKNQKNDYFFENEQKVGQAKKFVLNDDNKDFIYNVFEKSYNAAAAEDEQTGGNAVGKSWDQDQFFRRARGWSFYGIEPTSLNDASAGFLAVRHQMSGLVKLTGMAGKLKAIFLGYNLLNLEGKPIWGAVSPKLANMAEKLPDFKLPSPEVIREIGKVIPPNILNLEYETLPDGTTAIKIGPGGVVYANIPGVGVVAKRFIVNQRYIDWAKKEHPQYAHLLPN